MDKATKENNDLEDLIKKLTHDPYIKINDTYSIMLIVDDPVATDTRTGKLHIGGQFQVYRS